VRRESRLARRVPLADLGGADPRNAPAGRTGVTMSAFRRYEIGYARDYAGPFRFSFFYAPASAISPHRTMRLATTLFALSLLTTPVLAQSDEDAEGVRSAVEDYLEALYDAEPDRIERSVSRDLVKFGWYQSEPGGEFEGSAMTFEQLHSLAARWNEGNRQQITETSPRAISVLDVLDKTAVAKLTAVWGIDYFQLEKTEGRWMIRHVLWQSHPSD
jgi:putative lumazine-binding protein